VDPLRGSITSDVCEKKGGANHSSSKSHMISDANTKKKGQRSSQDQDLAFSGTLKATWKTYIATLHCNITSDVKKKKGGGRHLPSHRFLSNRLRVQIPEISQILTRPLAKLLHLYRWLSLAEHFRQVHNLYSCLILQKRTAFAQLLSTAYYSLQYI
jgi:hypothetical protein